MESTVPADLEDCPSEASISMLASTLDARTAVNRQISPRNKSVFRGVRASSALSNEQSDDKALFRVPFGKRSPNLTE